MGIHPYAEFFGPFEASGIAYVQYRLQTGMFSLV